MTGLIEKSNAYKVIYSDKKNGTLSHAYLVVTEDKKFLRQYLKQLAMLIVCENDTIKDSCRNCALIERETHPDVFIYPKQNEKLSAAVCDQIVSESVIRPFEISKKLFVIENFDLLEKNQNKLLKTLEEPPQNVCLIIGTTNETAVLTTVLSRVKKVVISTYSKNELYESLKNEYDNTEKLKSAIALADGKIGEAINNYLNDDLNSLSVLAEDILLNLLSSKDACVFIPKLKNVDLSLLVSTIKFELGELMNYENGAISRLNANILKKLSEKYSIKCIVELIEMLSEIERGLHFNINRTMAVDRLLFSLLEVRYKWQK